MMPTATPVMLTGSLTSFSKLKKIPLRENIEIILIIKLKYKKYNKLLLISINPKNAYDIAISINKIRHENLEVILSAIIPANKAENGLK